MLCRFQQTGLHTINVTHLGEHVSGSPFKFTVGPLREGGALNITAGGPGLKEATVNVPGELMSCDCKMTLHQSFL